MREALQVRRQGRACVVGSRRSLCPPQAKRRALEEARGKVQQLTEQLQELRQAAATAPSSTAQPGAMAAAASATGAHPALQQLDALR